MANNFIFPEWLVSNSVRAFPLSESASRLDTRGVLNFPDSLLVAAAINSLPEYTSGTFFISRLLCFAEYVSLELSFAPATGAARLVARVRADTSTHVPNTSYAILGTGEDSSVSGSLTLGSLRQAQEEALGTFEFEAAATPFEVACLFVTVPALKFVQVYNGSELIGTFDSVLRLRSGRNVQLRYVDEDTIAIDAIEGLNLVTPDTCEQLVVQGPPIKTINGIAPDANGNFTLDGSECIDLIPQDSGLQIVDTCSKSCCGCTELEALVASEAALVAQIEVLRQQILAVQANQTAMLINLVSNIP